jgi:hypothetical protein
MENKMYKYTKKELLEMSEMFNQINYNDLLSFLTLKEFEEFEEISNTDHKLYILYKLYEEYGLCNFQYSETKKIILEFKEKIVSKYGFSNRDYRFKFRSKLVYETIAEAKCLKSETGYNENTLYIFKDANDLYFEFFKKIYSDKQNYKTFTILENKKGGWYRVI